MIAEWGRGVFEELMTYTKFLTQEKHLALPDRDMTLCGCAITRLNSWKRITALVSDAYRGSLPNEGPSNLRGVLLPACVVVGEDNYMLAGELVAIFRAPLLGAHRVTGGGETNFYQAEDILFTFGDQNRFLFPDFRQPE